MQVKNLEPHGVIFLSFPAEPHARRDLGEWGFKAARVQEVVLIKRVGRQMGSSH